MRRLFLIGGVAAALMLPAAAPSPAAHSPNPPSNGSISTVGRLPRLTGQQYTVTLVTGDVVTVSMTESGCPLVRIKPATPSRVVSQSCGPDGHVRVVPSDALPLLGKLLDPALFDVTGLIAQGYDDGRSSETPLIIRYTGNQTRSIAPNLRATRRLASVNALAGRQPKSSRLALNPDPGVRQILLDRKVRATQEPATAQRLDVNLRQIDAPQAWRAGLTGKNGRVAVLDTGIDTTHPDLVGRVVESANFTAEPDARDGHGHGTHVASTIAGTGAASDGARRGVAFEAPLVIGKVLDRYGFGTDSQVIAGMEWAAPRATVVNMSLGGWAESDGSDPLSQALDALSRQYGTLFVVAAGNDGPSEHTVSYPGAAATALTVGAVDASDRLAPFSSRGPLINTNAVKPEIVAPGVDIVAARAAGTSIGRNVDQHYTALSGTSMATPHVAGAAALLAQRHPQWPAERLKAALIGAADPTTPADPRDGPDDIIGGTGAGRLNAAKALDGPVTDQGVVSLGALPDPQTGVAQATLAWTNTGHEPTTLSLEVALHDRTGVPAPATLSATRVSLAPGASAAVTLRVDRTRLAGRHGLFEGLVTAQTGNRKLRTPVVFSLDPPTHTVTVTATARPGTTQEHVYGMFSVINLDDPSFRPIPFGRIDAGQPTTVTVPAGRYSVLGVVEQFDPVTFRTTWAAMAGDPDATVNSDTAVVLDAAAAKKVTATVTGVDTREAVTAVEALQTPRVGLPWWYSAMAWHDGSFLDIDIYTQATEGVSVGSLRAYESFSLLRPGSEPSPYAYDLLLPVGDRLPADPAITLSPADQARLARIDQHYNVVDLPGSVTGAKRYGLSEDGMFFGDSLYDNLPATRTDYVSPGVWWIDEAFFSGIVEFPAVSQESFRNYAPGSRTEKVWGRQPLRPDWYDDPEWSVSFCQPRPITRTREVIHVELVDLADQHQRFDCLDGLPAWDNHVTRTLTLTRDGQTLGTKTGSRGEFAIPATPGTYTLSYDLRTELPVSTRVNTAWTFRSIGPDSTQSVPVPLLSVDYALPLDAANHPISGDATFTVRQTATLAPKQIESFRAWTSTDDGNTWVPVTVRRTSAGQYTATLPTLTTGQAMSLQVDVTAENDSRIQQTIIRAYQTR